MTVKSSLLEMLEKNKGEVLSGESIAGELGCTRAAVWKAVKSLREEGYHIEAGPNKGYMLAKDTNRLSQEGIRLILDDPKVKIDICDELESTNQTAKKEAMMGEAGHRLVELRRVSENLDYNLAVSHQLPPRTSPPRPCARRSCYQQ